MFVAKDPVLKMVAYTSWNINRVLEICDHGSVLLTRRYAEEVSICLQRHLKGYQWLAMEFKANPKLFRVLPKAHYLVHTAMQTSAWHVNPFSFHCFCEESWLGKMKCVGKQCHGKTMNKRAMQRYLICLGLYLENHRKYILGV